MATTSFEQRLPMPPAVVLPAEAPAAAVRATSATKSLTTTDFAVSAVVSGLVTKSACAPFDRIRLLYQMQGMFGEGSNTRTAVSPRKYTSLLQTATTIIREEGVQGLWRGNGANMLRAAFVYTLKFGTNDALKARMAQRQQLKTESAMAAAAGRSQGPESSGTSGSSLQQQERDELLRGTSAVNATPRLRITSLLTAGGLAGLAQKSLSFPLDLLSVRIALGSNTKSIGGQKNYDSIWSCAKRIYTSEGWMGFYKGIAPTILTGVPYVTLQMTFFELYKRRLYPTTPQHPSPGQPSNSESQSWLRVLLSAGTAGSLGSLTAQTIVFPGDTIRKRMMANGLDGRQRLYRNSLHCAQMILKREGFLAFYHGVLPMCIRALPSGAIQFGTYEAAKAILSKRRARISSNQSSQPKVLSLR